MKNNVVLPHAADVGQTARSTVLLGGTMEPIPFVVKQLFGYLPSNQVRLRVLQLKRLSLTFSD